MFRCIALMLSLCFAMTAHAGFDEAMSLYQNKDFDHALPEFRQLAEVGHHPSQFNIGVMYYRGEGVKADPEQAYAWMALSTQNGQEQWSHVRDKVLAGMSDEQKARAELARQKLFASLSDAVLTNQLAPVPTALNNSSTQLKIRKRVSPEYTEAMLLSRKIGWVDVMYGVGTDGTTRNHSIIYSPDKTFSESVLNAVKRWQFEPATVNGKPVEVYGEKQRFVFKIKDAMLDSSKFKKYMENQRVMAEQGDPASAYSYAYAAEAARSSADFSVGEINANQWYFKSAIGGYGPAQFTLGKNLLYGNMCTPDSTKALKWLERAATGGQPDAEYLLAIELLNGMRLTRDRDTAIKLLERAASANDSNSQLKLAWLYATSPEEGFRDGKKAQILVSKVPDDFMDHITLFEVRAATAAALGNFKDAVAMEKRARDEAVRYELPLERFDARLAAFKAGKPWIEEMLQENALEPLPTPASPLLPQKSPTQTSSN